VFAAEVEASRVVPGIQGRRAAVAWVVAVSAAAEMAPGFEVEVVAAALALATGVVPKEEAVVRLGAEGEVVSVVVGLGEVESSS